jgi:hypothetical protein
MLTQILTRTPPYVWAILALILVLGIMQLRVRTISRIQLLLMPAAMLALSIFTVASNFGTSFETIPAWIAGVAASHFFNTSVFKGPHGVTSNGTAFQVPGSVVPLLIMLAIFLTNYTLGVTRAIAPHLFEAAAFKLAISLALGGLSGLLLSRARYILQTADNPTALKTARTQNCQHSKLTEFKPARLQ